MQIIHERGDAQVDLTGRGTGMNRDYWHVLSPSHVLVSSCVPQIGSFISTFCVSYSFHVFLL